MRDQLIQYVELLFAGGRDCEDIKQEILQNTLDRYDDLIAEGKVPEAAYRLAITGIGDINEILGTKPQSAAPAARPAPVQDVPLPKDNDTPAKKVMRAIAVGLYIICFMPLFILSDMGMDTLGLCGTLSIVAVATVLIILGGKKKYKNGMSPYVDEDDEEEEKTPQSELSKSMSSLIWAVGFGVYFILSFSTRAWHLTWVIFPILAALDSLMKAILRNQEALHSDVMFPNKQKVRKSIWSLIWAVGLAIYFILGFATGAWYIIWLLFPIIGAVQGLANAVMDLKEAMEHET